MSCCLEAAILDTLRAIDCTPIRAENHFLDQRECTDCLPYLVLKVRTASGLRTSSGLQKLQSIEISAYFKDSAKQAVIDYRDLVEEWLFGSGCLALGDCGCFCLQGTISTQMTNVVGGILRYNASLRGFYRPSQSGSDSMSASLSASV